jgi:hypothetical protein
MYPCRARDAAALRTCIVSTPDGSSAAGDATGDAIVSAI